MKIRLNRKEDVYECCKCGQRLELDRQYLKHPTEYWNGVGFKPSECEFKGKLFWNPDMKVAEEVIEKNP